MSAQAGNPLHGITLETILNELVAHFGWPELGEQVKIKCFNSDPSISSSLKFLRRTPWAREKVESLYLFMRREQARQERATTRPAAGGRALETPPFSTACAAATAGPRGTATGQGDLQLVGVPQEWGEV
jgi:uncharacterized protein (DUF2132 family)